MCCCGPLVHNARAPAILRPSPCRAPFQEAPFRQRRLARETGLDQACTECCRSATKQISHAEGALDSASVVLLSTRQQNFRSGFQNESVFAHVPKRIYAVMFFLHLTYGMRLSSEAHTPQAKQNQERCNHYKTAHIKSTLARGQVHTYVHAYVHA